MIFSKLNKLNQLLLLYVVLSASLSAQIPSDYYNTAINKQDAALKTALHEIIKGQTVLVYLQAPTYFQKTDWHPDNYYWDMYSNNKFSSWNGSGMNREHSLPKSWWSTNPENTVAYSDLHNLYPSNSVPNEAKSNYPLGEVQTVTYSNGVIKVGTSNSLQPAYSGVVFEPADQFKGDFARTYMYMVTRYEEYANNWRSVGTSSMINGGSVYPTFKPAAVTLLLKWHRQDPLSEKEIERNNEVYKLQNNRNPFVDFPILAEHIWGKYIGKPWSGSMDEPGSDELKIKYDKENKTIFLEIQNTTNSSYAIYNVQGIRKEFKYMPSNKTIDVQAYEKGLYIVKVYTNNVRKTAKFIRE